MIQRVHGTIFPGCRVEGGLWDFSALRTKIQIKDQMTRQIRATSVRTMSRRRTIPAISQRKDPGGSQSQRLISMDHPRFFHGAFACITFFSPQFIALFSKKHAGIPPEERNWEHTPVFHDSDRDEPVGLTSTFFNNAGINQCQLVKKKQLTGTGRSDHQDRNSA